MKCSLFRYENELQFVQNDTSYTDLVNNVLQTQDKDDFTTIQEVAFRPWERDDQSDIQLVYKHPPPRVLDSLNKLVQLCTKNNVADAEHADSLQEFCPVYSREKHLHGLPVWKPVSEQGSAKCNPKGDIICGEKCNDNSSSSSDKIELANSTSKSRTPVWCACSSAKKGKLNASKCIRLKDGDKAILKSCRTKHNIGNHQRGKWILKEGRIGCSSIAVCWKKICSLITRGDLTHCNAKLQVCSESKEIWIYCDFIDSMKIHRALQDSFPGLVAIPYNIHPHGPVLIK